MTHIYLVIDKFLGQKNIETLRYDGRMSRVQRVEQVFLVTQIFSFTNVHQSGCSVQEYKWTFYNAYQVRTVPLYDFSSKLIC